MTSTWQWFLWGPQSSLDPSVLSVTTHLLLLEAFSLEMSCLAQSVCEMNGSKHGFWNQTQATPPALATCVILENLPSLSFPIFKLG